MAAPTAHAASGEAIRAIRLGRKLSQTALAQAAGIDRSQLWRIENGLANPYEHTLAALAEALAVPVSSLLAPP